MSPLAVTIVDGAKHLYPPINVNRSTDSPQRRAEGRASSPKSPLERQLSVLTPAASFDQCELSAVSTDLASPSTEGAEYTWHFRGSCSPTLAPGASSLPQETARDAEQRRRTGAQISQPGHSPSPSFAVSFFSAASRTVRQLLSGETDRARIGAASAGAEASISGGEHRGKPRQRRRAVFDGHTGLPVDQGTAILSGRFPHVAEVAERCGSDSAVTTAESSLERQPQTAGDASGFAEIGSCGKPATAPDGAAIRRRSLRWCTEAAQQRKEEVREATAGGSGIVGGDLKGRGDERSGAASSCDDAGAGNQNVAAAVDHSRPDSCANGARASEKVGAVAVSRRPHNKPRYGHNRAGQRSTRIVENPLVTSCSGNPGNLCHDEKINGDDWSAVNDSCTHTSARRPSSAASNSVLLRPQEDIASRYVVHHREVGSGQYGSIRKCLEIETGKVYACKTIKKSQIKEAADAYDIRREVASMSMTRGHPHIVTLHDTFEDRKAVHLVMELSKGGDLFDKITKSGTYSEASGAKLCHALTHAVIHCHANGIVHRDIKPENILLISSSDDTNIKLADFGAAAFVTEGEVIEEVVGTPEYMAPEMWRGEYGPSVDIWSMGVVMYIAMSGVLPFWATADRTIADSVLSRPVFFRPARWGAVSEECKNLIARMLEKDARKRITLAEIREHPWIMQHVHKMK